MKDKIFPSRAALLLSILLGFIALLSLLGLVQLRRHTDSADPSALLYADIYQNGELLQSINLSSVTENFTFTIEGDEGCSNTIEVHPSAIAVVSASCPDKLCVHQGFMDNTLLPITCLPNRLVILLRQQTASEDSPDMITY